MEKPKCEWVGSECGHHASYTFYKGAKYTDPRHAGGGERWRILAIGQFFFVKIWPGSDLVSVAELQLLWEDKSTGQMMSSVRLYFPPEFTAEGRLPRHGEDELIAVAEKSVLRVVDLLDWLAPPSTVHWARGAKGIASRDCPGEEQDIEANNNKQLDMSEVERVRAEIGDNDLNELGVVVVSAPNYYRYRSILKRLEGVEDQWMKNSLVVALGGFTTKTRKTAVMFAKEVFDYPELEEHPMLCNHLAPKLKGRPRKRRNKGNKEPADPNSPEGSDSNGSENSVAATAKNGKEVGPKVTSRKDLMSMLSQKNTKEEMDFLRKLIRYMENRGTPIERPPMLGFKQIDLHQFYERVQELGGYQGCMSRKAWKSVYDDLGGNPQNTSAATCTRRHYERFLLPYEKAYGKTKLNGGDFPPPPSSALNGAASTIDDINNEEAEEDEKEEEDKKPLLDESQLQAAQSAAAKAKDQSGSSGGKPYLGIKPLQLLTDPAVAAKQEEEDRKRQQPMIASATPMKLDDLILFPPNPLLGAGGNSSSALQQQQLLLGSGALPEELSGGGGSALQNLAKIASRYSALQQQQNSGGKDKSRSGDFLSPSAKKPRTGEQGVAQPLPPTTTASGGGKKTPVSQLPPAVSPAAAAQLDPSKLSASSLLQQFSLLSPALFSGWGTATAMTPPAGLASPSSAAYSGYNLDPSKIGQEGYNLLKYYEQQLKALQQGIMQSSPSPTAAAVTGSSTKLNGVKDGSAKKEGGNSSTNSGGSSSKGNKEKQKVCRPPPDTKRPPRLMQTPCQFLQTSSIYGSPQTELAKAKESAARRLGGDSEGGCGGGDGSNSAAIGSAPDDPPQGLDLSLGPPRSGGGGGGGGREYPAFAAPFSGSSRLTTTASLATGTPTNHSAASLLQPSRQSTPLSNETSSLDLSANAVRRSSTPRVSEATAGSNNSSSSATAAAAAKISPFSAEALLSRPASSSSANNPPPLSMGIKGILESGGSSSMNSSNSSSPWQQPQASKPAAPVPPVVRSISSTTPSSSSQLLMGLPPPLLPPLHGSGGSTETTFSSLSSLPSSSLQPPPPPGAPPTPTMMMTNPYLQALMSPLHSKQPAAAAAAPPPPNFLGINPLDPLSQYYAALYSQQLSAYNAAAAAAVLNPYAALGVGGGVSVAAAVSLGSSSTAVSSIGMTNVMAGLARSSPYGSGGGAGSSSSMAAAAAAAAEMQALQAYKDMMTRAALSAAAPPPVSNTNAASAAAAAAAASGAANPYAALYAGLMGYPASAFGGRKDP